MTEYRCSECRAPATRAYKGTMDSNSPDDCQNEHNEKVLFLFCDRHSPPLWVIMGDFEEISIDLLRVHSVMDP
jgi:hypothetical protein